MGKLTYIQYIRYLKAIDKKEKRKYTLYANIARSSFVSKKEFDNFLKHFSEDESNEVEVATEKDLKEMGFGKKG